MERRDIVVAAFCCGGKMSCKKEAAKFEQPPIIINVSGGSLEGFAKTASKYQKKSSILDGLLESKLPKNIEPKRIALISFSHGWTVSAHILKAKKDIERIDCVIVMDGIHTSSLKAWNEYAKLSVENNAKLWMAHTQAKQDKGPSVKNTNIKIIKSIQKLKSNKDIEVPQFISNVVLGTPIKVYSNIVKPHHKIYMKDTLLNIDVKGNVVRCEYDGNMPQDQTYNAQHVQPRFWRWLRQQWSNEGGVFFS